MLYVEKQEQTTYTLDTCVIRKILENGNKVVAADIKPKEYGFKILMKLKIIIQWT